MQSHVIHTEAYRGVYRVTLGDTICDSSIARTPGHHCRPFRWWWLEGKPDFRADFWYQNTKCIGSKRMLYHATSTLRINNGESDPFQKYTIEGVKHFWKARNIFQNSLSLLFEIYLLEGIEQVLNTWWGWEARSEILNEIPFLPPFVWLKNF